MRTHVNTCARAHTRAPWEGTIFFTGAFGSRATCSRDLVVRKKAPLSAGSRAAGAAAASSRIRARPAPHPGEEGQVGPGIQGEGAGDSSRPYHQPQTLSLAEFTEPGKPVVPGPGHSAPWPSSGPGPRMTIAPHPQPWCCTDPDRDPALAPGTTPVLCQWPRLFFSRAKKGQPLELQRCEIQSWLCLSLASCETENRSDLFQL